MEHGFAASAFKFHMVPHRANIISARRDLERGAFVECAVRLMASVAAVLACLTTAAPTPTYDAFHPGEVWYDTSGAVIDAHGAGLLVDGQLTYWYGEQRQGHPIPMPTPAQPYGCYPGATTAHGLLGDGYSEGVNAYVSDGDLYNWRSLGLVFAVNITGSHCLERPKVIKCPATGKYVLWAKGFTPPPDDSVAAIVATSDGPAGPFKLANASRPFYKPGGKTFADGTLYVASDATVYAYFRSRDDGLLVARLTDDCTELASKPAVLADKKHEGPAVFEHQGSVYLWTSGTSGWDSNPAQLLVNREGSFLGPFTDVGNPTHNDTTFDSQSTFILPNPAAGNSTDAACPPFIFLADRWQPSTDAFGRYVWLPLNVNPNGTVVVTNPSVWQYACGH